VLVSVGLAAQCHCRPVTSTLDITMHVRLAQASESSLVADVLSAAAAKLVERGQALWTGAEVSELAVAPHVAAGLYFLGIEQAEVVGVFRLQLQDRAFWPEMPEGTSAYLHKLAVRPESQGHGLAAHLLAHAVRLTRERRLRFLRLDCMAGRPKLRAVYESFGFRHHSEKRMGNQVFDRFELDAGAPAG
jgi:GNAT superfamily N-acetyltransferase